MSVHKLIYVNQLEEIADLQTKVISLEKKLEKAKFRLDNIKDDDVKVKFYTGFPLFLTLEHSILFLNYQLKI